MRKVIFVCRRRLSLSVSADVKRKYLKDDVASVRKMETVRAGTGRGRRVIGRGLAAILGVSSLGLGYRYATDEGTRRSLTFWSRAFPLFLHYRIKEWQMRDASEEDCERVFTKMHEEYSPIIEGLVLKLKGFYLKLAQVVSTIDFFIPPVYLTWLKKMQDKAPVELEPGEAEKIVEEELGRPLEEVFSEFDSKPCGCASIGQVHRAVLRETGEEVAIKVQPPGIEQKFRADTQTMLDFVSLAMPQHVKSMEEIQEQFKTEFDYVGEAENMMEVYHNVMPLYGDLVTIPRSFPKYCTKRVLVMDFLQGIPLIDGLKNSLREYARVQGRSYEEVEEEQLEMIRQGKFKDIDAEESRIWYYQTVSFLERVTKNSLKMAYNVTLGLVLPKLEYSKPVHVLNLPHVLRLVCEIHGHEVLIDGCATSDPHPGNIMLLDNGKLGLIDFGQCKRFLDTTRIGYAKLIIALSENDPEATVKALHELGNRTKYNKIDIQYRLAQFWHDRNTKDVLGDWNPQTFQDWCQWQDPVVEMNRDLIQAGRISVMLRGMGNAFGLNMSIATLWRPIAEDVLHREGSNQVR